MHRTKETAIPSARTGTEEKMYRYKAYGLGIHSALPLPELMAVAEIGLDVAIRWGKVDPWPARIDERGLNFRITGEEAYFFWDAVGAFRVQRGQEIVIDPSPGVEEQLIRLPLLGAVLAVLLYQRGALVLHSSAIAVNDAAIAFLGIKGSGKSTMAAALCMRGHQLVADDLVAVDAHDATNPLALPGFAQIKLWPAMATVVLGDEAEVLPLLHSQSEKRAWQITSRPMQAPVPLSCIFALGRGSSPHIELLRPQETMIQLIANLYAARFGQQLLRTQGARHFLQCAELARTVPTYQLKWPLSLDSLHETVRLVEDYLPL